MERKEDFVDKNENLFLENQLCFALYSTSLTMGKAYQPLLNELGVTYSQYLVLMVMWQNEQMTVSTLGQKLYLDTGTLTPLLKRLEQAGLIQRKRSDEDERQVLVSLSSKGKELRKKAVGFPEKILCAMESTASETSSIVKTLKSLRESLLKSELLKKK